MKSTSLDVRKINKHSDAEIAVVALNRPECANAFNGEMISELKFHFESLADNAQCRALILRGMGKNFCAGADLNWMKDSAELSYHENISEAAHMTEMFEALYRLKCPTIAVAQGAVYGGAVGLVAACDIALALPNAKFCLSEVKVGLIPAVIMPYVARKMSPGQLRRHALSARVMTSEEALAFGLVEIVAEPNKLDATLREELTRIVAATPEGQQNLKELHHLVVDHSLQQGSFTAEAIAHVRKSDSGQAGLKAFFNKQTPAWALTLDEDWKLDDA